MKRCDKLVEVGRRGFLTGVGVTVAGAAGTALAQGKGGAKTGGKTVASALVTYPASRQRQGSEGQRTTGRRIPR
jgi:arsenite oxidase small subunit